ncbi:hypothetical protein CH333_08100 [candidate division WOR-3 bacterium JGI_Cruoil_03_44_89]|uniref:Fatty acid-binding protein DegV n=1 Tax=candidate division WOR-3 bacterium JGI_Cruoil_03_44_89 TaxID=1973748 RepID=A0A235BQA8_UNCW3|nr:MAG: hypothetical protein CH333_08100 [candidate division WOR-3 bacterium JGI_Cruoil_03_44_89]
MIAIIGDSTGSMTRQMAEHYGVTVMPYYVLYGGKSHKETFDFDTLNYYKNVMPGDKIPTTSQPSIDDFSRIYEETLKTHDSIIHLTLSSGLSRGYETAKKAREKFGKEKIYVYDSFTAIGKQALLTVEAARRRDRGETMEEIIEGVKSEDKFMGLFGIFETLKYLAKGGRIGRAQALIGGLLSIKPILSTKDGIVTPLGKVRTHNQGLNWIIEKIKKDMEKSGRKKLIAVVEDAANDEWADRAEERLRSEFDIIKLWRTRMSVVIGTHIGPGAWAISYHLLPN